MRGLVQAVIIYVLALLLGVKMNWNLLGLMMMMMIIIIIIVVILGAPVFSTFSLIIACLVRYESVLWGLARF